MNCNQFELHLQELLDQRIGPDRLSPEANLHADSCANCQALQAGFEALACGLAQTIRSPDFASAVVTQTRTQSVEPVLQWSSGRIIRWAVATSVFIAFGWSLSQTLRESPDPTPIAGTRVTPAQTPAANGEQTPGVNHDPSAKGIVKDDSTAPGNEDDFFADLSNEATPPIGPVALAPVSPVAEIFRFVGRSLESPVRPLADATASAVETFIDQIPEPGNGALPGLMRLLNPSASPMMQMRS